MRLELRQGFQVAWVAVGAEATGVLNCDDGAHTCKEAEQPDLGMSPAQKVLPSRGQGVRER